MATTIYDLLTILERALTQTTQQKVNIVIKSASSPSLRLTGRSIMAFVLQPYEPLADWMSELDKMEAASPGFFASRPMIIDLSAITLTEQEAASVISNLEHRKIRIIDIEKAGDSRPRANTAVVPFPSRGGRPIKAEPIQLKADGQRQRPLYLEQNIRSGRSIYHPDGDVIVIGSVSRGAEIIASGSIHVYGRMSGRAIAGAAGNSDAQIFLRDFDAELVAIDGVYRTADTFDQVRLRNAARIRLINQKISIEAMN